MVAATAQQTPTWIYYVYAPLVLVGYWWFRNRPWQVKVLPLDDPQVERLLAKGWEPVGSAGPDTIMLRKKLLRRKRTRSRADEVRGGYSGSGSGPVKVPSSLGASVTPRPDRSDPPQTSRLDSDYR